MSDSNNIDAAQRDEQFFDKYADALAIVRAINPALGKMIARLGAPLIDEEIPTAQVRLDVEHKAIEFAINPEFYVALDDETAAAVITHEAYHVLLNHLSEVGDRENYPDANSLVIAHECLANDSLIGSTGLEPKQNPYRGLENYGVDFSYLTTPEAYAIVSESNDSDDEKSDDDEQENKEEPGENQDRDSNSEGDDDSNDDEDSETEGDSSEPADGDSGESDNQEKENPDDSGDGDSSEEPSTTESLCAGMKILGDGEIDPSAVREALSSALEEMVDDVSVEDLPQEAQNALESLADEGLISAPVYDDNAMTKEGYSHLDEVKSMNVHWVDLLAKINPKIKSSGKPKRVKDSWHAPNRRLMSVYPQVILPTRQRPESGAGDKGNAVPSFIIALDMSPSIPTELLGDLAAFASSIPEKLIKAYPITWSSTYRVFDPENPHVIVRRELTFVTSVKNYADKIAQETGTRPYVLVITDGFFNDASSIPVDEALSHWWFMGVKPGDDATIKAYVDNRTSHERVFNLRDFTS